MCLNCYLNLEFATLPASIITYNLVGFIVTNVEACVDEKLLILEKLFNGFPKLLGKDWVNRLLFDISFIGLI